MVRRLIMGLLKRYSGMSRVNMLPPKTLFPQQMTVRSAGDWLPKTQYDIPINPDKLSFPRVMYTYWETIPLFATTGVSIGVLVGAIFWAIRNKVDVVFTTHSRKNISRTMDLRNPTCHKMLVVNEKAIYKPWPELAAVLDRMKQEECKRVLKATNAATTATK